MLKQILNILWKERRQNGWIFCELLLVFGALVWILDTLFMQQCVYYRPSGYDIQNVYRLNLGVLHEQSPDYVSESRNSEDLYKLAENIRLHPEVEEVSISQNATPYNGMSGNVNLKLPEGHPSGKEEQWCYLRILTREFFSVFHFNDYKGRPISSFLSPDQTEYVFSPELAKNFFGDPPWDGRTFEFVNGNGPVPLKAVAQSFRIWDYSGYFNYIYMVYGKSDFINYYHLSSQNAWLCELCVRMKEFKSSEQMNDFMMEIGERLQVNNVYVDSFRSFDTIREEVIRPDERLKKRRIAIISFLLINVFFGIAGTFWLRTQYRKSEIGLRIALGSDRYGIFKYLLFEGLVLLLLTFPFAILYGINIFYFDLLKTVGTPFTIWRLLAIFGGAYLLLICMICLGIWLPARKSMEVAPAEALHYE